MSEAIFKTRVLLFAGVIVPELENNQDLQRAFIQNFSKLIKGIQPESHDKLKLLTRAVHYLSLFYNQRSLSSLSYGHRTILIEKLFRFRSSKIVGGITALRSLVFIAYYGIPEVWKEIDYEGPIVSKLKTNA